MLPLMEMLKQGGQGDAVNRLARQFQLSNEQAELAMESLLPAFSEGLKRNASDPVGFMQFMQALSAGRHAEFFDRPDEALSPQGTDEGNAILGHLFGSKEVSRAVAEQAARYSGLSQDMLKQMLPALAPMILGGLFKQMAGAPMQFDKASGTPASASDNPLGWILEQMTGGTSRGSRSANPWDDMIEQMTRGEPAAGRGQRPSGGRPGDNPFGRIFEEMMGGGQAGRAQLPTGADNPLGRIFEEMMKGGRQAEPGDRRAENDRYSGRNREQFPDESKRGGNSDQGRERQGGGLEDLFGEMFDTGRTIQKDYQNRMESIFEEFLKAGRNR